MIKRASCLLVAAALAVPLLVSPARAQTCQRAISVSPSSGGRGTSFTVIGTGFFVACTPGQATQPWQGVRIEFVQGSRSTLLATANASSDGSFSVRVRVPSGATTGAATVHARSHVEGEELAPAVSFRVTGTAATAAPATAAPATPEATPAETPVPTIAVESPAAIETPAPTIAAIETPLPTLEATPAATPEPTKSSSVGWRLVTIILVAAVVVGGLIAIARHSGGGSPPATTPADEAWLAPTAPSSWGDEEADEVEEVEEEPEDEPPPPPAEPTQDEWWRTPPSEDRPNP